MAKVRRKREKVTLSRYVKDTFDYDVSGLEVYVDEQSPDVMADLVDSSMLASRVMLMDNVKGSKLIKLITSAPTLQAASACGWTPVGGIVLTDKTITTVRVKIQEEYCNEDLNDTWAQIENAAGANGQDKDAPFSDIMISYYQAKAKALNEELMWNGDTDSGNPNLVFYDGYLKQWFEDGDVNVVYSTQTEITAANGFSLLKELYNSIPTIVKANLAGVQGEIACGYETARAVIDQVYNDKDFSANIEFTQDAGSISFILPTTNMTVRSYPALDGTNEVIGLCYAYMFFGTDLDSDIDGFEFKYDETEELLRFGVKWRSGVTHVFGQYFTRLRLRATS
tara:strand:- start:67 stop:1080 length:1014 start_codon:yes stop_codon:yes gene_type:complete